NLIFVALVVVGLLSFFWLLQWIYARLLALCLRWKVVFLAFPVVLTIFGFCVWLGFPKVLGWLPSSLQETAIVQNLDAAFPGLGREFMPTLDEGSFLYMPVVMPHGSIGSAQEYLQLTDMAIQSVPEVETVVGKLGRAESPLDPAPISMFETVILYKPEFIQDEQGRRINFAYDDQTNNYQ